MVTVDSIQSDNCCMADDLWHVCSFRTMVPCSQSCSIYKIWVSLGTLISLCIPLYMARTPGSLPLHHSLARFWHWRTLRWINSSNLWCFLAGWIFYSAPTFQSKHPKSQPTTIHNFNQLIKLPRPNIVSMSGRNSVATPGIWFAMIYFLFKR